MVASKNDHHIFLLNVNWGSALLEMCLFVYLVLEHSLHKARSHQLYRLTELDLEESEVWKSYSISCNQSIIVAVRSL